MTATSWTFLTARTTRALVVALLATAALLVASGSASAATHNWCDNGTCTFNGGQWYPEPDQHNLLGVWSGEIGCGCHTIGAGATTIGSIAYGTGTAFHSFSGQYGRGVAVNGTGSVFMVFNAHTNY